MNLNDLPKLKEPDKDTQYQFQNKAVKLKLDKFQKLQLTWIDR